MNRTLEERQAYLDRSVDQLNRRVTKNTATAFAEANFGVARYIASSTAHAAHAGGAIPLPPITCNKEV